MKRLFQIFAFIVLFAPCAFAQHGATDADLSAKNLQPAEGLKAELFASDPLFQNPVAFCIDEQGRFFISETHRYKDSIFDLWKMDQRWKLADFSFQTVEDRAAFLAKEFATNLTFLTKDSELIRLVEDKDGDGRAETSSVFADGFNKTVSGTAAGVLARKGELWFTCIPDLWKFKYDSTGKATTREALHTGYGVKISVSGHDMHGLALGPDGKIYFSVGDRGANVKSKEGRQLDSADRGCVFRCNPDGTELEIFATGLRNPQELAFDEFGNLWTHDNDTSGEDKSRVLHVVEGGEYGWRQSYQFMEGFGPWVKEKVWQGNIDDVLPPAGYGSQGPAGLAFYPGVGLPEKYKGAMLACDFPQGVWAYFKKEKGATYEVSREKFLWNFGATDVDFAPDGTAYVSDWGKSYNMPDGGRIYRVINTADPGNAAGAESKKLLNTGLDNLPAEQLVALLSHADRRVRMEAQFALAKQPARSVLALQRVATTNSYDQLARIHAIWALRQVGATQPDNDALYMPLMPLLQDADAEIQAQAATLFGSMKSSTKTAQKTKIAGELQRLVQESGSARVRFAAAMSLGRLQWKEAIPAIVDMLRQNADQDAFLRHAGVWALVKIGDFASIQSAAQDESVAVRRAALLCMRRMKRPEIAEFLNDVETALSVEAARAINDVPIPGAIPELAQLMDDCKCSAPMEQRTQFISRTLNANFRMGELINAGRIINFLLHPKAPEDLRAEGFLALSEWENPTPLDRVVGSWRPLTNRTTKINREGLTPVLQMFVESKVEKIAVAAITCARNLQMQNLSPNFARAVANTNLTIKTRVEALQALADIKSEHLGKTVQVALSDTNPALRARGVKLAAQINPSDAASLLSKLLSSESEVAIGQAVYDALGDLKDPAADEILSRQMDELLANKIQPELQLELLEAAAKRHTSAITEKLRKHESSFSQSEPLLPNRILLFGGNLDQGKKIFHERDDVGCVRCHAIKGRGGIVGPDLAGIATRQSKEFLLESILFPNKDIAPGFENMVVSLKGGISHAGLVKNETADEIILNSPEDGELTLKKADIEKRERSLSAMPEGLDKLLTRREMRDLLQYVQSLK